MQHPGQHLQAEIEDSVSPDVEPDVEVLLVEPIASGAIRLVIDHPDGVNLDLCERVTKHLGDLLEDYGLEVSSPGPERPLTKPDHFRRFLGRQARVRTREPTTAAARASPASCRGIGRRGHRRR